MNRFFSILLVAMVWVVLVSGGTALAQTGEPIRIGLLVPQTGGLAEFGIAARPAVEFRLEEAGWKVAGRPIKLVVADSAAQPAVALDQGKKLVEHDKVHVVIGPFVSGPRLAVEPYFAQNRIPSLTITNHTPVAKKFGWTIFLRGTFFQVPYPLGLYASEQLGLKNATTLATDFVAGRGYTEAFVQGFKEKGGAVIQQQWAPLGTADLGPYIVGMREADALVAFLAGPDMFRFAKQYAEFGLKKKKMRVLVPTTTALEDRRLQELGDVTLGFVGTNDYVKQLDKKFVTAFERKYGVKSEKTHATGYEAASVILSALEATKGDTDPEKLRSAILKLRYETALGPVSFTPAGVAVRDTYVVEVKKVGDEYAWVPVKKYPQVREPGD
jgi:branched-chain amino acid transport system substrate-binding protein